MGNLFYNYVFTNSPIACNISFGVILLKEFSSLETIILCFSERGENFKLTHLTLWKKQTIGVLKQDAR